MSIYYRSITNDFAGITPNLGKLQTEINSVVNIDPTCLYLSSYNDTVELGFDGELNPTGETALANVIATHDPAEVIVWTNNIAASLTANSTRNATFTKIGSCIFPGANNMRVKAVAWVDTGSYTIKVVNALTAAPIVEATLSNTALDIVDLGEPTTPSELTRTSIMLRRNGGNASTVAHIDALYFYYN